MIKIVAEKVIRIRDNKKKRLMKIISISGAPAMSNLPPGYQRGGVWVAMQYDVLEIYITHELKGRLAIGDIITQERFEKLLKIINIASKRFDAVSQQWQKKNATAWTGLETHEI